MSYYEKQMRGALFDERLPKDNILTMKVMGFLETPGGSKEVGTKWLSLNVECLDEIIPVLQEYRDKLKSGQIKEQENERTD